MQQRTSLWIPGLVIFFTLLNTVFAGITGTLSGRVFDKETGRGIPGVNVIIKGTQLGAATDSKGRYIITNIPAGKFDIEARMMGYTTTSHINVSILMDLRTVVDFRLSSQVLEMGEIKVSAERPMIQRDVTATTHFISQDEIGQLPVQSVKDIVDIQPGVAAGHIRGGRNSEVLYLVDGLPVSEAIEGKVGTELPMSSVIDMTVQTGGFAAEYGNAMSGVVNIITRDGGEQHHGSFETSGFRFQNHSNPFDRRKNEIDFISDFSLGGPFINSDKFRYYVSADYRAPYTRWKREDFGQKNRIFNNKDSYNINANGKLTWFASSQFKLSFQGLLSLWNWVEFDNKWKKHTQGLPRRTKDSYRFSLTAVHTLSPRTFYEVRLSQYNVLKSILGASSNEQAAVKYQDNDPQSWVIAGDYPWWLDHQEIHTIGKFDLVSQVTLNHQIKSGVEVTYYDLYKKSVQRLELFTYDPTFPQYISYNTEYRYFPYRGAAYIQDKIDYEGMIANIGIRWDFFQPRASRPALENKVYGDRSQWIIDNDETVQASMKTQFSPRLGLALPISPRNELHINYGYFFQMPLFDYLYTNSNLNTAEGFSPLGDPNLKPARTVSYEVSYKQMLSNDMLLDVTFFSKDVSNLVDNNTFLDERKGALASTGFSRFVNLEKVGVYGAEIFVKRRVGKFLSGKINYTYMVAKGTGSDRSQKFDWLTIDQRVMIDEYYLSWDQRHTFVANLDFRKAKNWGLNVLFRWNSPLPYTKFRGDATTPNNERMKPTSVLDIRFNKDFKMWNFACSYFFESLNTFNHKNILWMDAYDRIGGMLNDPGAVDEKFRIRTGVRMQF
ncbi:MAG: TonB-dependent receptor [Calditrichaeota bacterium]|nr:TonB-dependent receptor [Calditrichota bacterium]